MNTIRNYALRRWEGWAQERLPAGNPQNLNDRNLYILPSAFGWLFALMLLSLFTGAINYQVSAAFMMTFLLGLLGLFSAWDAHQNLKGLSIHCLSTEDVAAGQPVIIRLWIESQKQPRYGLCLSFPGAEPLRIPHLPPEGLVVELALNTSHRGYFLLPRIKISSYFPFGLFIVWGYARFNQGYYVYPNPVSPGFWPETLATQDQEKYSRPGEEEFYELKQTNDPWRSANRIAWKIAARGQGWYLKSMLNPSGDVWLFKLQDLGKVDLESGLQQLAYWLETAEQQGHLYGLQLKDQPTALAQGEQHLQSCLRLLAVYS